jgi:sortase (surface protein transpeptidase)
MIKNQLAKTLLMTALVVSYFVPTVVSASVRATTPVSIRIPKIKVSAVVEARGLTSRGLMQGPTLPSRVAWDRGGITPGNRGDAVMYGHLTDNHFQPAIFINLSKVVVGSLVIVTDSKGTVRTFKVTKKKTIRADQINYFDLVQPTNYIHLNLYTCAGTWNQRLRHYSHYLVVYTTLVSSVPKR